MPDPRRSIRGGCFVREAFKYNPDTWDGVIMYSLAQALKFSLDMPWKDLPESARSKILYGIDPKRIVVTSPPEAKVKRDDREGKEVGFHGIARRIERHYRRYRQRGEASSGMEAWLDKVMVEHTCPDCNGARVRATRLLFTVANKTLHDIGQPDLVREIIAKRIVEVARDGERDPDELCVRALKALGFSSFSNRQIV